MILFFVSQIYFLSQIYLVSQINLNFAHTKLND